MTNQLRLETRQEEDDYTVIRVSKGDIWKDIVIDEKDLSITVESPESKLQIQKIQEEWMALVSIQPNKRTPEQIERLQEIANKMMEHGRPIG